MIEKWINKSYGTLLDLYEIIIYINTGVRIGIVRSIGSGLGISVGGEVEIVDDREFGLEFGGENGSRNVSSISK